MTEFGGLLGGADVTPALVPGVTPALVPGVKNTPCTIDHLIGTCEV
jgi:hypothetical protein